MTEPGRVRIMIVDDHPVVRRGLVFSLAAFDDLRVIGEACSGEEAVHVCSQLRPDVVLMDMIMPGMDGVAATKAILARHPQVKVLALSSYQDAELVRNALHAGAIGYLIKDMDIDELAQSIRAASTGQSTLAKAATRALLEPRPEPFPPGEQLTDRQREVLGLVMEGLSNQEIAARLTVSLATVRFHVSSILGKLGAANRAEAAAMAVKYHLLD